MAEASASGTPTFKLVLVGDGGTGKVRTSNLLVVLLLPSSSWIILSQDLRFHSNDTGSAASRNID